MIPCTGIQRKTTLPCTKKVCTVQQEDELLLDPDDEPFGYANDDGPHQNQNYEVEMDGIEENDEDFDQQNNLPSLDPNVSISYNYS